MNKNKRIVIAKQMSIESKKRIISTYYNACPVGKEIIISLDKENKSFSRYIIVDKRQHEDEYYFLLLSRYNRIYLTKVVSLGTCASHVKVVKTSNKYLANKETFDAWIKKVRDEIETKKEEYFEEKYNKYEPISVRPLVYKDDEATLYKFMAKHKFGGEYYFVVSGFQNEFIVTKVAYYAFAKLILLNEKEIERNKERFESWIREAKRKKSDKKKLF